MLKRIRRVVARITGGPRIYSLHLSDEEAKRIGVVPGGIGREDLESIVADREQGESERVLRRTHYQGRPLPPPGRENIIVRTANPLPAPKDVSKQ